MPNISSYNSVIAKTVATVMAVSDINKDLNGQLPTEITCELEELSPGMNFWDTLYYLLCASVGFLIYTDKVLRRHGFKFVSPVLSAFSINFFYV